MKQELCHFYENVKQEKDKKGDLGLDWVECPSMTTTFTSDNLRCAHKTKIVAEKWEGGKIAISITSSCKDIQRYAKIMKEIHVRDIAKRIQENPIYVIASPVVGPECAVPCAVISAVWTEAGLVSKNLLKRFDTITIKYVEEPSGRQ
jgi:thiamine kinase-like enzyme